MLWISANVQSVAMRTFLNLVFSAYLLSPMSIDHYDTEASIIIFWILYLPPFESYVNQIDHDDDAEA